MAAKRKKTTKPKARPRARTTRTSQKRSGNAKTKTAADEIAELLDRFGADTARDALTLALAKKPKRKGRTKWDPEVFLELLAGNGDVGRVCKALGIGRRTAYDFRERHPWFAEAWQDAVESMIDEIEASTLMKARDGWNEPVFYQGQACGIVKRFSPMLMKFVLETRRAERYSLRWRFEQLMKSGGEGTGSELAKFVVATAHAIDAMMPGGSGEADTDETVVEE